MARIIPPGFAECSIEHWLAGYLRPAVTTMGVSITGTETSGQNVADHFHEAFRAAFQDRIDANVTIRSAKAVIGQDGADPVVQESTRTNSGTSTRDSTAPALALMLSKRTALGGRAHRGRMYFPWAVSDTGVAENGAVQESTLSNWQTSCDNFLDDLNSTVSSPLIDGAVVLHSAVSIPPTPITGMSPNPAIRTQRRRQVRF